MRAIKRAQSGGANPCKWRFNGLRLEPSNPRRSDALAKTNYAFAKRQRDLAKKQKNEAKRLRKAESAAPQPAETPEPPPAGEKTVA
jgi:hypothetical protein